MRTLKKTTKIEATFEIRRLDNFPSDDEIAEFLGFSDYTKLCEVYVTDFRVEDERLIITIEFEEETV